MAAACQRRSPSSVRGVKVQARKWMVAGLRGR